MRYFSYGPEGFGLQLHDTADEACGAAEKALDEYRDMAADDGWPECVTDICWGQVTEAATLTSKETACEYHECDGDCEGNHPFDEYWRYELRPDLGFVVELNDALWLADTSGNPERTLLIENAQRFATYDLARAALRQARQYRAYPGARIQELAP